MFIVTTVLSCSPREKNRKEPPSPPPEIASLWTPHSPRQFSFLSCFRGEGMDVFWNYTMHIGDSKLCCFHSPTPVSTLQTWLTTSRPGGHSQKSRYRDFAVSSSLNILRTKTGEHDNAVKHLKRSKLYTTYSMPGGSVTTPINIKVTKAAVSENGWKNSAAFKCQYNYHAKLAALFATTFTFPVPKHI